jgi:hypothetical protein
MSLLRTRAVLACALLTCLASPGVVATARAQSTAPDPFSFARYTYGALGLTPGFWMTVGHDSNATREQVSFDDYEGIFVPQLESWLRVGRARIIGVSALEVLRYREQKDSGTLNHFNSASLVVPNARVSPSLTYSHRDHYARPTGFEIGRKSRRVEDTIEGSLGVDLASRFTIAASGRQLRIRYDADAIYQASSLREKLNRNTDSATVSLGYKLTPLTRVFAGADYVRDRFELSPDRDGDGYRTYGGVEFDPQAFLSGAAMIGRRTFTSPTSGSPSFSGMFASAQLAYANQDRTRLVVGIDRDLAFSFNTNLSYYVLNSMDVGLTQRISSRLSLAATYARHTLGYNALTGPVDKNPDARQQSVTGGLSFRVGTLTRVGVDVDHTRRLGGESWNATRVVAFFAYGTDRLQRLDRPLPGER